MLRILSPAGDKEEVMRHQDYVDKAKLSPARIFKSPMDVVETNGIGPSEKLAILQAWEADEQALLRAEDEGMAWGEGSTRIFTRYKLPSINSGMLIGDKNSFKECQHVGSSHCVWVSAQHLRQHCAARPHA